MGVASLLNTATDCLHFVTKFFEVISQSAPHIYHSALLLAPQSSIVRKLYSQEINSIVRRVVTGVPSSWDLLPNRIQLLYPEISTSPSPHNMPKPHHGYGNYLVAYSVDRVYVAIAQQGASVITVLGSHLDILQQSINTAMEIWDIRFSNDTIVVVDKHKLARWSLKTGEFAHTAHSTSTVAVDEPLAFNVCLDIVENLTLSNDCSHIAFTIGERVHLYNVKSQKINKYTTEGWAVDIQFSPAICQLQLTRREPQVPVGELGKVLQRAIMKVVQFISYPQEVRVVEVDFATEHKVLWVAHPQSLQGYYVGDGFKWVMDSRDRTLLWIPPNWRGKDGHDVRWEGNFLAIVKGQHLGPIIIEFPL